MTMRIVTSLTALLMALAAAAPAHAQLQSPSGTPGVASGPKLGQLEIKAYQVIPKTKTAVQLSSDTALARKAYQDFLATWKDADPDLPLLIEAKKEYEKLK